MRIAIVGAGLAGLTLSAALHRNGIEAHVYEQAPELAEVGAGIQLAPNAGRLLHRLGLADRLDKVAVQPVALEMRRYHDNAVLFRHGLGADCAELYGAPYYTVHRAHLHQALLDLLPSDSVTLDSQVVAVTDREGDVLLEFADGRSTTADLVVGADGIHSLLRARIVTDQPRFSGHAAYRGLVPAERLPHLLDEPKVLLWFGPGQHVVCYPIAGGRTISFVATAPAGGWRVESWQASGSVEELEEAYAGWHPEVLGVLRAADSVQKWALHDRDPLRRWRDGRVVMVGDAAHPVLPFGAQGAAQGIEDAAALARCLTDATPTGLDEALDRYERNRRPRIAAVRAWVQSNTRNHHYDDGEQQRQRDGAMDANWGLTSQEWLYGYDAERLDG
ncbi:FAD-dependent monooxygenase [Longispora urticae]